MRSIRKNKAWLVWLMSVAATCNVILVMIGCLPAHARNSLALEAAMADALCRADGADAPLPLTGGGTHDAYQECSLCRTAGSAPLLPQSLGLPLPAVIDGVPMAAPPPSRAPWDDSVPSGFLSRAPPLSA